MADILLIGSGGREHALAWKLQQSTNVGKLYIAPGNGGTRTFGDNVDIEATDINGLLKFALKKEIDLTIVGPENPLAHGIVDLFMWKKLKIFGPMKNAAQIETSKAFAKELMTLAGVPTAEFKIFVDAPTAIEYVQTRSFPIVIKDSGLATGKGVRICTTISEAEKAIRDLFLHDSKQIVIEEFLEGPEISIHAVCVGTDFQMFPASQDHKRIGEGDTGDMTGGIGAITPLPFMTDELMTEIGERIIRPVLATLLKRGTPFFGILYPGLMLTKSGIKVLEFNARFGDPECGVYMRLLKSDLLPVLDACAQLNLKDVALDWYSHASANLVLCSGGYPGEYKKGLPITGIEEAEKVPGVFVFHAGTKFENGKLLTSGGRVLQVSAIGATLQEALTRAYQAADLIQFEGKYLRRDIGAKAL